MVSPKPTKATNGAVAPGAAGASKATRGTVTKRATRVSAAHPATIDLRNESGFSVALVPVPKSTEAGADLEDPRRSDVDEWGRSEHMRELARRIYGPLYQSWHRVEWEGLDKIPATGGALLVSNHAGAIPSDAPSIMHGIETELGRPVYGLADEMFKRLPVVGTVWSRVGGVVAHPDNAYRLLREQEQLALVFPEGTKGTGKTYGERYQLRRFGRGGFVQIAMRAGVPVIPLAVVGAEESMPILWKSPPLAKAFGIPYFPITANMFAFAALGPLGMLLDLPAKIKIRVLDPVHFDVEPDQPRYSRSRIMDESEAIRLRIQEALFDMLRSRASVWFG
jgi:1-acyl-sn-glycerol-3-phosphate acyltransferase